MDCAVAVRFCWCTKRFGSNPYEARIILFRFSVCVRLYHRQFKRSRQFDVQQFGLEQQSPNWKYPRIVRYSRRSLYTAVPVTVRLFAIPIRLILVYQLSTHYRRTKAQSQLAATRFRRSNRPNQMNNKWRPGLLAHARKCWKCMSFIIFILVTGVWAGHL